MPAPPIGLRVRRTVQPAYIELYGKPRENPPSHTAFQCHMTRKAVPREVSVGQVITWVCHTTVAPVIV